MRKRSINSKATPVMGPRPDGESGAAPAVQRALDLIDTAHPSWPSVAIVLREFTAAGIDLDEMSAAMAVKLGRQRWEDGRPDPQCKGVQMTLAPFSDAIVYYIRRGGLVKIGTTADPYGRFRDLVPDEILAFEPGDRAQEQERHRQFMHLQVGGEYFRDDPELRAHIGRLRKLHGAPDPDWPTTATLQRRKAARKVWQLPSPTSTETMTAAQAVAELGIKDVTLRGWVHRGRIHVAGYDDMGRHLFYREHLAALRDSTRARLVQRF